MDDARFREALSHHHGGGVQEAEALYRQIVKSDDANAQAWHFLGLLLSQTERATDGLAMMRMAIGLQPGVAEFHCNLAGALGMLGRYDEAIGASLKAVEIAPQWPVGHHNLAVTLERATRFVEAVRAYKNAIALDPNYAEAHDHLGNTFRKMGRLGEAIECHRKAIGIRPLKEYCDHLAWSLMDAGMTEQAVEAFREAVRLDPGDARAHSSLLFGMQHQSGVSSESVFEESRAWARRHERPVQISQAIHVSVGQERGRLRIGYVSPDFREHVVARFFEPVLENHDQSGFEVFCYSHSRRCDATTERLKGLASAWRDIALTSDREAADLIREDRIDILVDLAGHTNGNRLPLFGWRTATMQVSYLGYPATTGMACIDYRITDAVADPIESTERYTEKLIRLPGCAWSYRPSPSSPAVSPLPALRNGFITFAALHRQPKLSSPVLATWGRLMSALPGSRLLLSVRVRSEDDGLVMRRLERYGIDPNRLELIERRDHDAYLETYGRADIALDAFPYNGTTTTCDALWMGLPVVTLRGDRHVSRTGVSLLTQLGRCEWIGGSEGQYIEIATSLASDFTKLSEIRSTLRARMSEALVNNAVSLTREIESRLRNLWMEHH